MECVGARFRDHFHLPADGAARFGGEQRAIHAELGDGVFRHQQAAIDPHVLVADAGGIDSVDAVIDVVSAGRRRKRTAVLEPFAASTAPGASAMNDCQLRPFTGNSFSCCEEVSELTETVAVCQTVRDRLYLD